VRQVDEIIHMAEELREHINLAMRDAGATDQTSSNAGSCRVTGSAQFTFETGAQSLRFSFVPAGPGSKPWLNKDAKYANDSTMPVMGDQKPGFSIQPA